MAIIKSGNSTDQLRVNTAGAALTTLLDANGNPINAANPLQIAGALTIGGSVEVSNDVGNPLPVSGTVIATGPATDAQMRATPLPVSGTVTATGPLTDTQLRATAVPVAGPATDAQLRATPLPVSGTVAVSNSVLHVDDNSGSLTVDGTVSLGAGAQTVGKVDQGAAGTQAWKVDASGTTITVNDGGAALTVDAVNLNIRPLAQATDTVQAVFRGATSGNMAEVDAAVLAQRVAVYPKNQPNFGARVTTGVLAAALAAGAPIFGIRAGATPIYVIQVVVSFSWAVAATAMQQFGLVMERFSGAALAGGQAYTPLKHRSGDVSSAADIRAATTAALTSTGVTFDGSQSPLLGWTSNAAGFLVGPLTVDLADCPIKLLPGEGLCIRNLIAWPAAGTGVVSGALRWEEF
jgi:hypothetical protein